MTLTLVVPVAHRGPLKDALEELFTNVTINLLSEPGLWPDYSSTLSPAREVPVSSSESRNVYVCAQGTLWVAYGLVIAFSAQAVALDTVILLLNRASYDNSFYTALRVGRTAQMTVELAGSEGDGLQPLPRHLGRS